MVDGLPGKVDRYPTAPYLHLEAMRVSWRENYIEVF
jgi:hypothetical protein